MRQIILTFSDLIKIFKPKLIAYNQIRNDNFVEINTTIQEKNKYLQNCVWGLNNVLCRQDFCIPNCLDNTRRTIATLIYLNTPTS